MTRALRRGTVRLLAVVVSGVLLAGAAGCVPPAGPGGPRVTFTPMPEMVLKHVDSEERTDLEPLVSRIPALAEATGATWFSGRLEDQRVPAPGPALHWIDAVVTLPPGSADELRETLALEPAAAEPNVVEALRPHVPEGLLTGPELDTAFSHGGWHGDAYLAATGDDVVLVIVAE